MDFYDLFSVDKRASKEEIKQAYREFVEHLKCDKRNCDEEEKRLLEIAKEGYYILMHNDLRKKYDVFLNIINGNPVSEDSYYSYEKEEKAAHNNEENDKNDSNQYDSNQDNKSHDYDEREYPPPPNREEVSDEKIFKVIKYILIGIGIFTVFTTPWLFFIAIIVFLIWVKSSKK